ncbi:ATP-binding cassette domain-containing protein, partial [Salmonella enterica]|nr:ATP-binding cassette domain-containing protein [Salmonella enterica]
YCERDERTLFRGLSFTVDAGEWVQVTGGNGAGKTTLLRLLTGLARPDGGEVYWQGEPLRRVRDSFHRSLLWIGHQPGIKTRLTARENLHFFHPGDGARLPEALAQAGRPAFGRAAAPGGAGPPVADPRRAVGARRAVHRH